jgi:hypothetical protein
VILWRWTGVGWLSPILIIASLVTGALVGSAASGGHEGTARSVSLFIGLAVVLALAPVHWLVGRMVNSEPGPNGRVWFDQHTFANAPMQNIAFGQAWVAVALMSLGVGHVTSAWAGWAMFGGAVVGALLLRHRGRLRRQTRSVADREQAARANGWRYRNRDTGLALRWKETFGRRIYTMVPFGILSGEHDGMPFTVFGTEVAMRPNEVQTICVVHLPVSYPTVRVDIGPSSAPPPTPEQFARAFDQQPGQGFDQNFVDAMAARLRINPEDVRPTPADDAFGQALLTPAVRELTARHRLFRWRIQGRDLIYEGPEEDTSPAVAEVLKLVAAMVELAHGFPPGLAERYGTSPTTDIPLVDQARPGK